MMKVHICDYGSGNILSVERALEKIGAEVRRCTTPEELTGVERLIIPGVGAFANCMQGVRDRGFDEPIRRLAHAGVPVLGICVGMQILASKSEEFGETDGLGLIPGTVREIPGIAPDGEPLKRPHVGWSALHAAGQSWAGTPFAKIPDGATVYFVHSFHFVPDDPGALLAQVDYGGVPVVAAVRSGRVFGVQFHPEKSGHTGLEMLEWFAREADAA